MKHVALLVSGWLISTALFAEETAQITKSTVDPVSYPTPFYAILVLLFSALVLTAVVAYQAVRIVNLLNEQIRKESALKRGIVYVPSPGWWQTFMQRINASVPLEHEKNIELEHSYDGIKELDNHLPPWWKWLFYGTIAWAAVYMVIFHFSATLPLSEQEYRIEMAQAEEQARRLTANQSGPAIDENNLQYVADPAILEKGKSVFASNPCGSCHRHDGGGNTIGPNLTDPYWIHGGDIKSIFNTIKVGAVDKGMPAWGKAMSVQDLRDLTFYIMSLQGTNPADAKAPQGQLFTPESPVKADTTGISASL